MIRLKFYIRIKANPKALYSFVKSSQKVRAKVGPFPYSATGFPNASPDFAADALRKQYDSVFADLKDHFSYEEDNDSLNNIHFCPEDIEKACAELKPSSASGPNGIPAILLYYLWHSSLVLLLVLISPIHKG